ncbi:MAG: hypothetical protein KGV59_06280 [Tenacibaculum sp.]|nr:hypothetical protein [Tenacibaculum sp.]
MKTKEQKLKAVTDDIRAKLPRLMELEKGCLVRGNFDFEILKVNPLKHEGKVIRNDYLCWNLTGDYESIIYGKGVNELYEEYKILGKEPTILDCLEYLNKESTDVVYLITMDGELVSYNSKTYCDFENISREGVDIDLSKPLLKDNEELINFLYELL